MTIEIKNYDTFSLIKGFLEVYHSSSSAQSYDEAAFILEQMKNVPSTDNEGNFIEDQRELCKLQWLEYEQEFKRGYMYSVEQKQARDNFFAQIGEALGPVCYAAWKFKQSFEKSTNTDWIDKCIKYYEKYSEELI